MSKKKRTTIYDKWTRQQLIDGMIRKDEDIAHLRNRTLDDMVREIARVTVSTECARYDFP